MAESRALSQWEIDALLNQIPDGGEQEESNALATPQAIYKEPATRFVAEFVGRNNIFEGTVSDTTAETIRVQTSHGAFAVARRGQAPSTGRNIAFVVRADLMRGAATAAPGASNSITGVIKGLEYAGSVVLMVLDLGEGQELKVEQHESLSQGEGAPRHGNSLTVTWSPGDAYVLPT